jgi:hypothetical protein
MSEEWLDKQLDMTDVDAFGSGGPYEEGLFRARVDEIEPKTSSNNNPMLEWEFKLVEGPDSGRSVRHWTVLTEDSRGALLAVLEAFDEDRDWSVSPREIIEELTNEEVRIYVDPTTYETDEGEERHTADIGTFLPIEENQSGADVVDTSETEEEEKEEADIPF